MFFSRISFKLAVMIGISLAGMVMMAPIALYTMRAQMMTDRQAKTQQMIDVGYGILTHYQKLEADGKLARRRPEGRDRGTQEPALRQGRVFLDQRHVAEDDHASDQARA